MMSKKLLLFVTILIAGKVMAQKDTSAYKLDSIMVNSYLQSQLKQTLPDVYGTFIYAGKKTDLINANALKGNLAQSMGRLQFAQIPGLDMWEMDGAGT